MLVTGHTGFKGSWLCRMLINAGATLTGYSLEPPTEPNLFSLADLEKDMISVIGDIRDFEKLRKTFNETKPEIVFHLAAQPIVRESYKSPCYTYETNVMGTVNLMECVRLSPYVKSVLIVTTDKVYKNNEWCWGYREEDSLDGFDPYSNSKSCAELVTHCFKNSFFSDRTTAISTARAGNVIGGGDFAIDRIIPDCIRALINEEEIGVRNPYSVRPYQHVLEPLLAYLVIAAMQFEDLKFADCYNIGPNDDACMTTGELVSLFCKYWGQEAQWKDNKEIRPPSEANFLKLDCSKMKYTFNWKPRWDIKKSVEMTCRFSKVWMNGGDIPTEMDYEIHEFLEDNGNGKLGK